MPDALRNSRDLREQEVIQALALYDEKACSFCFSQKRFTYEKRGVVYTMLLHEGECPVIVARKLLYDLGTPVKVYVVSYDYCDTDHKWRPASYCLIARTEEDAAQHFGDTTDRILVRDLLFTLATPLGEH